jgi:hypothetical protein
MSPAGNRSRSHGSDTAAATTKWPVKATTAAEAGPGWRQQLDDAVRAWDEAPRRKIKRRRERVVAQRRGTRPAA